MAANQVDPNWLLSTTAQSAVALVAIIGGFLVSRVLGLNSEREQLLRKCRELRNRAQVLGASYQEIHDERLAISQEWFLEAHLDKILDTRGAVSAEELLDHGIPIGSSDEEMAPFAARLLRCVVEARAPIEATSASGAPASSAIDLRAAGVEIPRDDEWIYNEAAKALEERRGPRSTWPSIMSEATRDTTNIQLRRQDERIAKETAVKTELDLVESEQSSTLSELDRLGNPWGLKSGLVMLAYLLLVGVIYPVYLLMQRPVPSGQDTRTLVAVLFLSGLVGLVVYIGAAVRHLSAPPLETD